MARCCGGSFDFGLAVFSSELLFTAVVVDLATELFVLQHWQVPIDLLIKNFQARNFCIGEWCWVSSSHPRIQNSHQDYSALPVISPKKRSKKLRSKASGNWRMKPRFLLGGDWLPGRLLLWANVISRAKTNAGITIIIRPLQAQALWGIQAIFPENCDRILYFLLRTTISGGIYLPKLWNLHRKKIFSINEENRKAFDCSASSSLLYRRRRDVIVSSLLFPVSMVRDPQEFAKNIIKLKSGDRIPRNQLLSNWVDILYSRTQLELHSPVLFG